MSEWKQVGEGEFELIETPVILRVRKVEEECTVFVGLTDGEGRRIWISERQYGTVDECKKAGVVFSGLLLQRTLDRLGATK